ncbi:MAG: parvulin peptidyl-prolyl isomerase [Proteobacteria bacterium]|jgi:parvulin-like peptidyl-prolyl isomerase|nr:parvulin peptidyl-prolyl isomerase [Pseudomonadota bacterium]
MRASHILLEYNAPYPPSRKSVQRSKDDALYLAQELAERVRDGEAMSDLANVYSDCPSREEGGDLGRFGPGQMTGAFEDAVVALEIGQISDAVHTEFGFHVIKRTG